MSKKITLLKTLQTLVVSVGLLSFVGLAQASLPAKGRNAQKIAKLKLKLSAAKGQKRVKLIKEIAEMENKVLEHKLQSFK